MEQENDHHYDHGDHFHDQTYVPRATSLNFDAPFLSTRLLLRGPPKKYHHHHQHSNSINEVLSCSSVRRRNSTSVNDRVPFSWEKAPGKPKDDEDKNDDVYDVFHGLNDTPRPKLPPSLLWQFRQNKNDEENIGDVDDDEGCDADVEEEDDKECIFNDRDDVYSDAVDVFSLSEAIDIVERSEKRAREITTDRLKLKIIEDSRNGLNNQYPDFIIQRFLPDATALATASALGAMSLKKSCESYYNTTTGDDHHYSHRRRHHRKTTTLGGHPSLTRTASFSSTKGCGFDMFFPWKHKWPICGVKSPVRHSSSFSTLQLKHKKRSN